MKIKMIWENAISIWLRGVTLVYTFINSRRFRNWGEHSRLSSPAIISCPETIEIGNNVRINEHAWLNVKNTREDGRSTLIIGNGTYIGRFVHINASYDVVIENDVLIADSVFISDDEHIFTNTNIPIIKQGNKFGGSVLLCTGCWIGHGVVILPGVKIGRNSVVGANSVVTRDIPDYSVYAGVPAKEIRKIKS